MRVIFSSKMFKIKFKFRTCQNKIEKNILSKIVLSEDVAIIVSIKKRILVIGSQWDKKQSEYFMYHSERLFQTGLRTHWSISMVKVLSFRFQQCFSPFTMLLVQLSSETRLYKYLSNHFFGVRKFKITSAIRVIFFLEMFKIKYEFRKCKKIMEKKKLFWDNCIWRYCNKLPLLGRQYLLSAVNGLTNSPQILGITQRDFFKLNCLQKDQ